MTKEKRKSKDYFKKKLEKIEKTLVKGEELSAESYRRFQVAQEKLAGWLIEWIESQRVKLKEKKKIGVLLGILLRILDLRTEVMKAHLSIHEPQISKFHPLKITRKMVEVYNSIRTDLSSFLIEEDKKLPSLPSISDRPSELFDPESKLIELYVCLGQLSGYVLGKLYEFIP